MTHAGESRLRGLLRLVGFTNARALDDDQARALLLPTVLADFTAAADYSLDADWPPPVRAPITAIAGARDLFMAPELSSGWVDCSDADVTLQLFDDHHYFIETEKHRLHALIRRDLLGEHAPSCEPVPAERWRSALAPVAEVSADAPISSAGPQLARYHHRPPNPRGSVVLVADTFASGLPLASTLATDDDLAVIELRYPSRPMASFTDLLAGLAAALRDAPPPKLLVGVGYGGVCAHQLASTWFPEVLGVTVVNAVPPPSFAHPRLHDADDELLMGFLAACGRPALDVEALPQVRRELSLAARLVPEQMTPVQAHTTVLRASFDMIARGYHTMGRWADLAPAGKFEIVDYEGDHFSPVDTPLGELVRRYSAPLSNGGNA